MQTTPVTKIMTPAGDLPSVGMKTCLLDAAEALKRSAMNAPVPLLVAVRDDSGQVAGVLGMVDLLCGLNPKYAQEGFFSDVEDKGVSPGLLEMFVERYKLIHESLEAISAVASAATVGSLLRRPDKEETVDASASLDVAMDLMVLRRRDYLLVTDGDATIGVIDAAGVYDAIIRSVGLCAV